MGVDSRRAGRPRGAAAWREAARFLPDVFRLLLDVTRDGRVPFRAKVVATGVIAYLASPIDVVPDVVPVAGQMDDLAMGVWAVRYLVRAAGYEVLQDLWRGSDDGFFLLLLLAGVED